jgi:RNA polymerase sigma factor (sigma-70 family)
MSLIFSWPLRPATAVTYGAPVERAQGLEALYGLHRADLLRFLIARTGDRAEAEDVLQELWIRVQGQATRPVANGRAYLYRMAQNLVLDRVRSKARRMKRDRQWLEEAADITPTGVVTAGGGSSADEVIEQREEAALLASAIASLPQGARRALELHKIEGLSHAEVAERMGVSRSGVEKHMAVAMKYLRRALMD